ncbi:MAG: branched-chain amino acid transport system II carrier protein [Erysipelotrichaceae bacterium]|nr:branched-chain amino acid transport system II carrier protein [Erysipelotrichaceae bacterium]
MKHLSFKESLLLGILLFSMFFGSGNLIFPPFMGFQAGQASGIALTGFSITAILFPVLGVIAIAKTGDLIHLGSMVSHKFATIFAILVFLALGPGLAIPRNAAVSFEMAIVPFMKDIPLWVRIAYSLIFFAIAWLLSVHPEKLVDWLGKIMGPILIGMMLLMVIGCFTQVHGVFPAPSGDYASRQLVHGFLDGYNTMDTLAALSFGSVIALNVRNKGIQDEKRIVRYTISAGWIAGILLFIIYAALTFTGALSGSLFSEASNGANVLANIISNLFGLPGMIALAVIYVLSCLTTCIGLTCACSEFFASVTKISYKTWITIFTCSSFLVSIIGLNQILAISVPVLTAIYPIAMVLVILGLLPKRIRQNKTLCAFTITFTAISSIILGLHSAAIDIRYITTWLMKIPPCADLCWLIPALSGALIGFICFKIHMHESAGSLSAENI